MFMASLRNKLLLVSIVAASFNVWAGDRPYISTSTAVAEEDDDNVWAVASSYQKIGNANVLVGSVEYAFNPTNSIQFEFTRTRTRTYDSDSESDIDSTEHEAEIEFKHLFNHIARDGWGLGVTASLLFSRPPDDVWRHKGVALNVPFSLALWERSGFLHLNLGATKEIDETLQWNASAAIERKVAKDTTLFAEVGRKGQETLLHGGIRYWVKREKFAIDFSLQRTRDAEQRRDGFVIGFNLFDL